MWYLIVSIPDLCTITYFVFFCGSFNFSVLCLLCLCAYLFICALCYCRERADLLALVCGVKLCVCHFPIGTLGQVWYVIVLIPDICTLPNFKRNVSFLNCSCKHPQHMFQLRNNKNNFPLHTLIWWPGMRSHLPVLWYNITVANAFKSMGSALFTNITTLLRKNNNICDHISVSQT